MKFLVPGLQGWSLVSVISLVLVATGAIASESSSSKQGAITQIQSTVVKLSDGDTLQVQPLNDQQIAARIKVRMMGIDTAETHVASPDGTQSQGYWGEEGAAQLARYVSVGDVVTLEVYGEDSYGRKLGKIIKKGEDINLKMVKSGWAALYLLCDSGVVCRTGSLGARDSVLYREACREAVRSGRGLFDRNNPVPELPFVFRANVARKPLARFVADLENGVYVQPNDYEDVHVCDRLFYSVEADALRNGFEPSH